MVVVVGGFRSITEFKPNPNLALAGFWLGLKKRIRFLQLLIIIFIDSKTVMKIEHEKQFYKYIIGFGVHLTGTCIAKNSI